MAYFRVFCQKFPAKFVEVEYFVRKTFLLQYFTPRFTCKYPNVIPEHLFGYQVRVLSTQAWKSRVSGTSHYVLIIGTLILDIPLLRSVISPI